MRWVQKLCIMGLIACLGASSVYANTYGDIEVIANNGYVGFKNDVTPIIQDDRILVPVKYIGETFGSITELDTINGILIMRAKGNIIEFKLGSTEYKVKGQVKQMDTAPVIYKNNIYLPIRYAFEIFDVNVEWDGANKVILVDENANTLADYTNYAYSVSAREGLKSVIKFRSNYDSGLTVSPGDKYKGLDGNSIVKFYVYLGKNEDTSRQISQINGILSTIKGIKSINSLGTVYGGILVEESDKCPISITTSKRVGDYVEVDVNSKHLSIDLNRIDTNKYNGYGAIMVDTKTYMPLNKKGVIESRKANMIKLKNGTTIDIVKMSAVLKDGSEYLLEDKIILLDNMYYLSQIDYKIAN